MLSKFAIKPLSEIEICYPNLNENINPTFSKDDLMSELDEFAKNTDIILYNEQEREALSIKSNKIEIVPTKLSNILREDQRVTVLPKDIFVNEMEQKQEAILNSEEIESEKNIKSFTCCYCKQNGTVINYMSQVNLDKHYKKCKYHPDNIFECEYCKKQCISTVFYSKLKVDNHMAGCYYNPSNNYECEFCKTHSIIVKYNSKQKLESHITKCRNNPANKAIVEKTVCELCNLQFRSGYNYNSHIVSCKNKHDLEKNRELDKLQREKDHAMEQLKFYTEKLQNIIQKLNAL